MILLKYSNTSNMLASFYFTNNTIPIGTNILVSSSNPPSEKYRYIVEQLLSTKYY